MPDVAIVGVGIYPFGRHKDVTALEMGAAAAALIRRLQKAGQADPGVDPRYAAWALGGMVAAFAAALFVSGAPYEFEQAVEQLTILWANALGIARPGKGPGG